MKHAVIASIVVLTACVGKAWADTVNIAAGGDSTAAIQAAIDSASSARTIVLDTGTHALSGTISVNKADITIQGTGPSNTLVQTSGTGYRFSVSASGAIIEQLTLQKTDKTGVQNLIYVGASNTTIRDNVVCGQYVLGDPEVSRAIEITYGLSGLLIEGNEIYALRQPAYINGSLAAPTTGLITNNYVHGTRGWVIAGANMTFTGNTWGTGADVNYLDIAILAGTDASYYTDIPAISAANNGAVIEDQRSSPATLSTVYVDAAAAAGGDGTVTSPYQTITPAITRAVAGGTVQIAAGAFAESVVCRKSLTLHGAGCGQTLWTAATTTGIPLQIQRDSSTPADLTLEICGIKFRTQQNQLIYAGWNPSFAQALRLSIHDCCFEHINTPWDLYGGQDFGVYVYGACQTPRAGAGAVRVYENTFDTHGGVLFENCRAVDVLDNQFDVLAEGIIFNYYSVTATYGEHVVGRNEVHLTGATWNEGGLGLNSWFGDPGTYSVLPNVVEENAVSGDNVWYAVLYGVAAAQSSTHTYTVFGNSLGGNFVVWGDYANTVLVNASGNWWGNNSASGVSAAAGGSVDYTPWLDSGTDTSTDPGFQGDFSALWVDDDSPQTGTTGRIQEGIDLVSGSTVYVAPGAYEEQLVIDTDGLQLIGSGSGSDPNSDSIIVSPVGPLPYHYTTGSYENYPVIGVHDATGVSIEGLRVDGYGRGNANYRFNGIAFWNAGGAVTGCYITGIQNTPFSGAQHGVGIYANNNTAGPYTLDITDTTVTEYQKNGMALLGTGLVVTVDGCIATGKGAISTTAQNGIQIGNGAGGAVADCTITGHMYTGSGWAATGLLFIGGASVAVTGGTFSDNFPGVYCQDTSATFDGLVVSSLAAESGDGLYACNTTSTLRDAGTAPRPLAAPIDAPAEAEKGGRGAMTVAISNSTFTGHDAPYSWGIGAFATGSMAVDLTVTTSTIQHWDSGIVAYYDASGYAGPVTVDANYNRIVSNVTYGFDNQHAAVADAEDNDWGFGEGPLDATGTYEVSVDDCGASATEMLNIAPAGALGNAVSGDVDYCPWLIDARLTLRPQGDVTCYKPADTLVVEVFLSDVDTTNNIVGGDFFLAYDRTKLDFVGANPGDDPFLWPVYQSVDELAGTLDYGVGVAFGNLGTQADTVMARITFKVLDGTDACAVADLVTFRIHDPPTKLSDYYANPVYPALVDLAALAIDSSAPVIAGTVGSGSLDATCGATVPVSITLTDNCGLLLADVSFGMTATSGTLDYAGVVATQTDPQTVTISGNAVLTGVTACSASVSIDVDAYDCPDNNGGGVLTGSWADTTAPTLSGCDDITVPPTFGECQAPVTLAVMATDNCDPTVPVTYEAWTGSAWQAIANPYTFPSGTTPVRATAVDDCGNVGTCEFDVTVESFFDIYLEVESDSLTEGDVTRCITFEVWDCDTTSREIVPVIVDLTRMPLGGPYTYSTGAAVIQVPCGKNYDCITARDKLHSLRRTAALTQNVGLGRYEAAFTAAASARLLSGNLNDDAWIDILDFGAFSWQFTANPAPGADTDCSTAYPHADLTGNGTVNSGDFTPIFTNYLKGRDVNCCGQPGFREDDSAPVTRISVDELYAQGLGEYAAGDITGDGWLDEEDVAAFASGTGPAIQIGDLNCDGVVNFGDINPFVQALISPASWAQTYPGCNVLNADVNEDGVVNFADINLFVALLSNP